MFLSVLWIQIRINLQMTSQKVWNMSLFEHFFKIWAFIGKLGTGSGSASWEKSDPHQIKIRIRIRIKYKTALIRIRILIRVISRIRIRMKVMQINNKVMRIHNTALGHGTFIDHFYLRYIFCKYCTVVYRHLKGFFSCEGSRPSLSRFFFCHLLIFKFQGSRGI